MRASPASHGKKVSSTYTRYACGTFLPNSLYPLRLFSKVLSVRFFSNEFLLADCSILFFSITKKTKLSTALFAPIFLLYLFSRARLFPPVRACFLITQTAKRISASIAVRGERWVGCKKIKSFVFILLIFTILITHLF